METYSTNMVFIDSSDGFLCFTVTCRKNKDQPRTQLSNGLLLKLGGTSLLTVSVVSRWMIWRVNWR